MERSYSKESLNEIAGGDEDFMEIVANTFLEEIPPDLAALQEAIANDNKELAYQFAHKMKPNLEMFGIDVQKDVAAIENWTKTSKSNSTIEGNIDRLVEVLQIVFKELQEDYQ
ncbi:MAG: Hpt domain-containing protein [Patiriisocius sp.]|uniref:Hpt domain-containing protein n=1 Tax=Patiriisocius sp. TaxID=2822396 RepID=UPI003EF3B9FB